MDHISIFYLLDAIYIILDLLNKKMRIAREIFKLSYKKKTRKKKEHSVIEDLDELMNKDFNKKS